MSVLSSSYGGAWSTRRRPRSGVALLLSRLDGVLLLAAAGLVLLGALLVWSATSERDDPTAMLERQLLNVAIGLVIGVAAAVVDYRTLRAYAPLVYGGAVVGLLLVLSPLGKTVNGAHSWLVLGGFQLQPAELAKVAIIVGAAMLLAERREGDGQPRSGDITLVLALVAVPAVLIMLQPDLGTVLILLATLLGLLLVSGVGTGWILGLLVTGVVVAVGAVAAGVLDEYQVNRFAAFANPELDPRGVGYNVAQARIAIGAGGLTGTGLFEGSQTSGRFIPEQHTDFIFTVAGEELGFLGAGTLVVLLGLVLWRGLRIAAASPDLFGALVAAGVVSWWAFQSFINIGMCLGIMPVTGLPLPFVSYGGSAMFASMAGLGLLLGVHARSRRSG